MDDNVYSEVRTDFIPDSGDILQHLLAVETRAATLVDEAQAEADKRIKAAEERNRERYEEAYRRRVEDLEAAYREKIGVAKTEYRARLDAYRKDLDTMILHRDDFSCLVEKLLFGDR
jgi:vacuolar-type H+-ATPase subunit H